jgi:hypothetical protein
MMNVYAVRVFSQGTQRGGPLYVTAPSAAEAMNQVEAQLGLKPACFSIDQGKMTVVNWHGYEFKARQVQD